MNTLMQSCDVHECGDLTLPHIGKRRCRAHSSRRVEASDDALERGRVGRGRHGRAPRGELAPHDTYR
ncbi:MAG TPA: hypothetical protein VHB21_19515 [Minicystis sp.]|nr:hypothetical protein [Minicystis sp.]